MRKGKKRNGWKSATVEKRNGGKAQRRDLVSDSLICGGELNMVDHKCIHRCLYRFEL